MSLPNTVGIAQFGRASDCGSECRGFESHYPPHRQAGNLGSIAKAADGKDGRKKSYIILAQLYFVLLFCGVALQAQSTAVTGTIQGIVLDSSGAPMPNVQVTAVHVDSGAVRQTSTGDSGQFRLTGLAIGNYELRAEREGFGTVVTRLQVSVGQTVVQRVEMAPAAVSQSMEVKEQSEALDVAATTSGATLGSERIEEAPAQNRNYLNFVLVAPGAAPSSGSNPQRSSAGVRSAAPDSGFSFGGMRPRNNSLSIDGVDNRDETTGANRVAIGLEMVEEFRVAGTAVGAELGGASGGIVNVVTRSGTNIWHGDWTFFGQNEAANARNPEAPAPNKPRFRRYQPGSSINGPIRRDQTFFSTAFEQEWESSEEWSEGPAAAQPAINAVLARPELANAAVDSIRRGLFRASSAQSEFSVKLNHQLHSIHALSVRYALSHGRVSNDVQGTENFSDRSSRGSSLTTDHSLVAGLISVLSPRLVNDLRFQAARRDVDLTPNSRGAMMEIPGVVAFGQAYGLNGRRSEDHNEMVEGLNLAAGQHHLSFGASAHLVRLDARLADRFAGIFVFPTLADFLAERPDVFVQAFGNPATEARVAPLGAWAQDRWQPLAGLSLEAGLRYDYEILPRGFSSPSRNFAPRFGIAYRPGGKGPLVFRAGFGLFYDRYPLAYLNNVLQKDGIHGFEQYLVGDMAVAALAAGRGGSLSSPMPNTAPGIYKPSPDFSATYSRKFVGGVERSLGQNTSLTAEYASVAGFHLPRIRNIAATLPPLYQLEQTARSSYQGVSVSINRRMSRELTFLAAYNLGRTWDDSSDYDEQPLDPRNLRQDWARSRQHQAHRISASAVFELPAEEAAFLPKWVANELENVVMAPIFTAGSGRPVNALDSTDVFRTGAYPISARPFGLPRNPFFGPGTVSLDMRIMKGVWLKKNRMILQTGVEAFNLANHTNALRVSPYYAAAGQILGSYRGITEALNARQLQFVFQIEY